LGDKLVFITFSVNLPRLQPSELLKEIIQPACEAGGQSDSPRRGQPSLGKRKPKPSEPTKWATDETFKIAQLHDRDSTVLTDSSSVARSRAQISFGCHPRLGCLAWGYHSLRQLRWLIGCLPRTLPGKQEVVYLYFRGVQRVSNYELPPAGNSFGYRGA